jgi:microcystin-dependent protein
MNGTALMGADSQNGATTTNLVSVPVQSGSRTAPTSILGENLHVLTVGELATHNHTLTDPGHSHSYIESVSYVGTGTSPNYFYSGISGGTTGTSTTGITIAPAGSNTAHNTVPRSTIVYWNLKL